MKNIHPAGEGNPPPPAKECRCSHVADVEKQSASCSVPSEDPYLETQTWNELPGLKWDLNQIQEFWQFHLWSHRLTMAAKLLL